MDSIQKKLQSCTQGVDSLLRNIDQLIKDKRGAKRVSDQICLLLVSDSFMMSLYVESHHMIVVVCVLGHAWLMWSPCCDPQVCVLCACVCVHVCMCAHF